MNHPVPITPEDALFLLLDFKLSVAERKEILMQFADSAWRRGWDDCEAAFQRFLNDETSWPIRPEPPA